jgi:hypothetical protein
MSTVAISMHDHAHAETHYLCDEANNTQALVRFRDVFLGEDRLISAPRVNVVEALRHFHARKREFGLGPEDVLVAAVQGNLHDDANDEYFFRTSSGFPELASTCPGIGVMSLFYRLDPTSEFREPRNEAARARKSQWWDPKSDTEKTVLLSNALLLMLLDLVATLVAGLVEHDDTRGRVLDLLRRAFSSSRSLSGRVRSWSAPFTSVPSDRRWPGPRRTSGRAPTLPPRPPLAGRHTRSAPR